MKFDINRFKLDESIVRDGVEVDFGGGAAFRIAPFDNPSFQDAFRRANKPWDDLGSKPSAEEQEEIMCRVMSQFTVLGWSGVFDGDKVFPYSPDNAYRLLKEVPRVRARVIVEAQQLDNFQAKAREENEGN